MGVLKALRWKDVAGALLLLVILFVQLPLLPVIALIPPLDTLLKNRWSHYFLSAPVIKFTLGFSSDLAFAMIMAFVPRWWFVWEAFEPFRLAPVAMLTAWSTSSLLWELRQLVRACDASPPTTS